MIEPTLEKGEEVFLEIKDSARRRIVCGLRWDPIDEKNEADRGISMDGGSTTEHDLDLLCLTFDKHGRFLEAITGLEGQRRGDGGNIYHTGDVVDGDDDLDDEQLSMELFNLSTEVHQIFFIAEVQSAHKFGHVHGTEIRLASAIADTNFAHAHIGRSAGSDKNAFIFGGIYRVSQGWNFKYVGEYLNGGEVETWESTLSPFLQVERDASGKIVAPPPMSKKGESVPLHYTKEARRRIVCGLNWDPLSEDPSHEERLKAAGIDTSGFDLDLACVAFSKDKEAVDGVSAQPEENVDESGKIYHSGDDTSGEGDRVDDEAISVELKDLPDYIHHIVFMAEIQSSHHFEDILNPSMRIADGKTNQTQLKTKMNCDAGRDKNGHVFACITRRGDDWMLTNINEYFVSGEVEDIIAYLKRYLP